jgi:Resolvase, N terminal domain
MRGCHTWDKFRRQPAQLLSPCLIPSSPEPMGDRIVPQLRAIIPRNAQVSNRDRFRMSALAHRSQEVGTWHQARLRLSIAPDDFAILAAEGVVPNEGLLGVRKHEQCIPLRLGQRQSYRAWPFPRGRLQDCHLRVKHADWLHACVQGGRVASARSPTRCADRRRVKPSRLYEDEASGKKDDRPGLNACLKSLREGDTLVVWTTGLAATFVTSSTPFTT